MFTLGPREIVVGLGSNAPDALTRLRLARTALRAHSAFRLKRCSAIYRSEALLPENAPAEWNIPFLNAACLLETDETSPVALITILKNLERMLGRTPAPRWAPRVIDLDLLAWGREPVQTPDVMVPHTGLESRPFALLPAQDCVGRGRFKEHSWRYDHPQNIPLQTQVAALAWPEVVGILNVTPDSFSDGSESEQLEDINRKIESLCKEGATVIDVGAESTRPGAIAVSPKEEIKRLAPALSLLDDLKKKHAIKLSLDTRHPETAQFALAHCHIDWLNDVEGFCSEKMRAIAAEADCDIVFMHSLNVPPVRENVIPLDRDPTEALIEWARMRISQLTDAGISEDRLIFDPGIGFGKTAAQNLTLITRAARFNDLKIRLLFGHSRKRFLDTESNLSPKERDLETAILTAELSNTGVDYIRVHAPNSQFRALKLGARTYTDLT